MTDWKDHLQAVRNTYPGKSLKECMQIASSTYNKSGATKNKRPHKSSSKSHQEHPNKAGKKLKSDVKETLRDIVGFSKDLMSVPDMISSDHLKLLQNACKKIQMIHEKMKEEEEEEEDEDSSSNDQSTDSDSD